jgi:hypothetical protein
MKSRLKHFWRVAASLAMLAIASHVQAQVVPVGDAATPAVSQSDGRAGVDSRAVAALREPRDHDALFQSVTAALIVSASTDLSVSMYQVGRGTAREVAFGAPWQDSPVVFALTKSAVAAAMVYGLQRMHKTRPKTALVLGIATTAVEGWLTARSALIAR